MDNDHIGARIAAIIKALNIKKVQFAEKLKIDQSYVTQLTNGRRNPSERLIRTICHEFNVDERWLLTGKGNMFQETLDTATGKLAEELGLDDFMKGIVSEYLKLNIAQREIVREFVCKIARTSALALPPDPASNLPKTLAAELDSDGLTKSQRARLDADVEAYQQRRIAELRAGKTDMEVSEELDLSERVAALERQNQEAERRNKEMAAELAAIKEEDAEQEESAEKLSTSAEQGKMLA